MPQGDRSSERRHKERLRGLMERLSTADDLDRLTWPLDRLWTLRDQRLRELIAHAKDNSAWHGERLAGVEPREVTAESLAELPMMDKHDLMGNWDAISSDRRLTLERAETALREPPSAGSHLALDDYLVMSTSGSSGTPTVVAWDLPAWIEMAAVVMRAGLWLQRSAASQDVASDAPFVQATVTASRSSSMSHQLGAFLATPTVEDVPVPALTPLPELVARLNEVRPSGVFGYSSALAALAGEAAAGRLTIRPAMIGASSEPLLAPMRELISDAFGVEPSNTFAVTELGAMVARTFPGAPGMRLAEDIAVFEIDETGALVATNVLNKALPLIRYRLGDRVEIEASADDVPWTGRRIAITETSGVTFGYASGASVDAFALSMVMDGCGSIVDYAIAQTASGVDVQAWAPRGRAPNSLESALVEALTSAGLQDARASVSFVDDPTELPRTAAGKRHRFIPA